MWKAIGRLVVLVVCATAAPAEAATYYVAASGGSDARSCGTAQTIGTPKLTINNALGCLSPGDTLLVRGGNYDENITFIPSGTSWSNIVRIAAYPSETVWLRPTTAIPGIETVMYLDCNCHYIELDGINVDGRPSTSDIIWTSTNNGNNPHHIRLKNAEVINGEHKNGSAIRLGAHATIGATGANEIINLTIHGGGYPGECGFLCASYGIYVQGPNNIIDGCNIYDTSGAGIQTYGGAGDPVNGTIIRNTRIHDISRTGDPGEVWGIIVAGSDTTIQNVAIWNITKFGTGGAGDAAITVGNGYNNVKIWNVTIFNVANGGIYLGTGSGHEVRNTIIYQAAGTAYIDTASGTGQSNNLFGVNPRFVNAAAGDLHLQSTSPAIDAGMTLAGVTTDIAGVARPKSIAYDIGAYEFGSSSSGPAAPTNLHIVPD